MFDAISIKNQLSQQSTLTVCVCICVCADARDRKWSKIQDSDQTDIRFEFSSSRSIIMQVLGPNGRGQPLFSTTFQFLGGATFLCFADFLIKIKDSEQTDIRFKFSSPRCTGWQNLSPNGRNQPMFSTTFQFFKPKVIQSYLKVTQTLSQQRTLKAR